MNNSIVDLRNHLFETLEKVKDGDMDLEQAKVVSDLAQRLINSAKVEVDFLKTTGELHGTGFIENDKPKLGVYKGSKSA